MSISVQSSSSARELDPLLKDLTEKKHSFRRNVLSMAAELKDVRNRLVSQEETIFRETLTRQQVETKATSMEMEIMRLQKSLEESNRQLQSSASAAKQYLKDIDDLRSQLSTVQATADANAISAESAKLQCLALLKELDEKSNMIKDYEDRVYRLGEQLKDLQAREASQNQVKDEVLRMEQQIMNAVAEAGATKDCELRKLLDEVSPKNIEMLRKHLTTKDEEIARLRDEIRGVSRHYEMKIEELKSEYLEKNNKLMKRVNRLEYDLQLTHAQNKKLQKMLDEIYEKDKTIKELGDQLALALALASNSNPNQKNFWGSSAFTCIATATMAILVVFTRR